MPRLAVTDALSLDEDELSESFILASGPGGQNVNKVSSAVQLRFDVAGSPSLPEEIRVRLRALAGQRLTKDGVLVILARAHRTQERNRADAREKLFALIREAATPPKPRRPTKPTKASKRRRLDGKSARAKIKRARGRPSRDD
jgi:ribosome-associated protein